MIRAVVDTNVYVSALVFGGTPAAVLQLAESGAFPPQDVQGSRDPGDDFILACALESQAAFVVTGDQDLLALHPFRGVAVVTPAAFLARIARAQGRR